MLPYVEPLGHARSTATRHSGRGPLYIHHHQHKVTIVRRAPLKFGNEVELEAARLDRLAMDHQAREPMSSDIRQAACLRPKPARAKPMSFGVEVHTEARHRGDRLGVAADCSAAGRRDLLAEILRVVNSIAHFRSQARRGCASVFPPTGRGESQGSTCSSTARRGIRNLRGNLQ